MEKNPTSPEYETLSPESINILETASNMETKQPPLTPDMSPVVRPEVESIEMSMPHFPLSETKLSVIIDKTQDIILELLTSTAEIYLAQEEVFQNKEIDNPANSPKWKYRKGSKGNKLKAPYKDRKNGTEINSNGLENHSITVSLKSLYFTRKQWLGPRKLPN